MAAQRAPTGPVRSSAVQRGPACERLLTDREVLLLLLFVGRPIGRERIDLRPAATLVDGIRIAGDGKDALQN